MLGNNDPEIKIPNSATLNTPLENVRNVLSILINIYFFATL